MAVKALIVDDSRVACKVLSNLLEQVSITSDSVYSAEDAFTFLKHQKPDIIFMDHSMPSMDGLEAIKVFKSNPLTATIPVMMYTAKEGELYVSQARALGAVDVLPKGMEKRRLHEALIKLGLVTRENINKSSPESDALATTTNNVISNPSSKNLKHLTEVSSQWSNQIKPFLNQTIIQQTDTVRRSTREQTRQIVKEFHRTLEHFEHAITSQLNSHRKQTQPEVKKPTNQTKWRIAITAIVLSQMVIMWQLWDIRTTTEQLLDAQNSLIHWHQDKK